MLLLVPALLGILGALWHGGSLRNFAHLPLHWPALLLAGIALRALAFSPLVPASPLAIALYCIALVCLTVGLLYNRHIAGLELILVGLLLNALVTLANGGAMPVSADALRLIGHADFAAELRVMGQIGHVALATPATQFLPLADIIPLPAVLGLGTVASVGDFVVAAGLLVVFYLGSLYPLSRYPEQQSLSTTPEARQPTESRPHQKEAHATAA